jgi:hypothetical protein
MSIYAYLVIVAAIAACGLAFNRLFLRSFLPGFSEKKYWVFSIQQGTGGMYQTSEKLGALAGCMMLTLVAAALVFWRIPLKSPLDRILAVASVPATGVAVYIAWRFLAFVLLVGIIALVGWGIYAYVFK